MKRLLVILSIISLFHSFAFAQKKEISQAQTYVKTGKNLDKAEASMRKLLADSANHANIKIWHTLTEAIRLQYEQANEQLYLKQKFDTASLFNIELRMFQAYESMDSVDALLTSYGTRWFCRTQSRSRTGPRRFHPYRRGRPSEG